MSKLFLPIFNDVEIPEYATEGSSGMDVKAYIPETITIPRGEVRIISTGLEVDIPTGYELQVRSRSSMAITGLIVANAPGTIDSDYKDEIMIILANIGKTDRQVFNGQRIAQLVYAPVYRHYSIEVSTIKRTGGLGSTGR